MSKNNPSKISLVFVFWALAISAAVIFILFLLFLSLKDQKQSTPKVSENPPNIPSDFDKKQQETYNKLLNKLDKEIDKITSNDNKSTDNKSTDNESTKKDPKYRSDGTLEKINEYDPQTGRLIKCILYNDNGKSIISINEYDPTTEKTIKITEYDKDTKLPYREYEYNPEKGQLTKQIYINKTGLISGILKYEYDPSTDNKTKTIYYNDDEKNH
uniref:DUF2963 domain-containing protein n=1 Tax=Phytoplasma australiense TaxID=59748 RepID=Q1WM05_PHYAS|nr:DUF2963 domain-containing protein [Candidatus Phytoplasma australiense]ABA02282.1 unknown [Candidatus Phytoplasma australiense]